MTKIMASDGEWKTIMPTGSLFYDPEAKQLKVMSGGKWQTVGSIPPSSATWGSHMKPSDIKNHPRAYKRKDGKTQCPDCHALSFDAFALNDLECTVPPEPIKKKAESFHLSALPPVDAHVGDIWIDHSGALRVASLIEPGEGGVLDKMRGAWIMPTDRARHYMVKVPAPWENELNAEVKEIGLSREVTYLKNIDDIEQDYYKQEMLQLLQDYLDEHRMIAVSPPKFELLKNLTGIVATAHITALARAMPDPLPPLWKHEWWNEP